MTIGVADLAEYVGAADGEQEGLLTRSLEEAMLLVDKYVGDNVVPQPILDSAYLLVGADLFNRRQAPNGIMNQQYATIDGNGFAAVRIARDPLAVAYGILRRWVMPL